MSKAILSILTAIFFVFVSEGVQAAGWKHSSSTTRTHHSSGSTTHRHRA